MRLAAIALLSATLIAGAVHAGARSGVDGTLDVTVVNAAGQVGTAQSGALIQTAASVPINVSTAQPVSGLMDALARPHESAPPKRH